MFITYESQAEQLIEHEKLQNYVFKNLPKKWMSYIYKLLHASYSRKNISRRNISLRDGHNLGFTIKQISFLKMKANEKHKYTSRYTMRCTYEKYDKQISDYVLGTKWVRYLFY